jgi:hypothetical protein
MSITSPNLTTVPLGSAAVLIDSNGNKWGLTLAGVITLNGVADKTTTLVAQIALIGGAIWQQAAGHGPLLWWKNTALKAGAWIGPGASQSPLPDYVVSNP